MKRFFDFVVKFCTYLLACFITFIVIFFVYVISTYPFTFSEGREAKIVRGNFEGFAASDKDSIIARDIFSVVAPETYETICFFSGDSSSSRGAEEGLKVKFKGRKIEIDDDVKYTQIISLSSKNDLKVIPFGSLPFESGEKKYGLRFSEKGLRQGCMPYSKAYFVKMDIKWVDSEAHYLLLTSKNKGAK